MRIIPSTGKLSMYDPIVENIVKKSVTYDHLMLKEIEYLIKDTHPRVHCIGWWGLIKLKFAIIIVLILNLYIL